jgi:hypothetical protein
MIWCKQRFQHAFELLPRVLKEVAPLLLPISLLIWGLEFYVNILKNARFEDPYNSSMLPMVIVGLTGLVIQCLATVISLLYVARSTQRQMKNGAGAHPWIFLKKHFHQVLIEYLRAFISTGIYTLFLILPGVYRWVRLSFTGLVAAFDPDYQKGKKDALEESSRLLDGLSGFAMFFLLVAQISLPLVIEEPAKGMMSLGSIPLMLLAWVLQLYFAIYFSLTFFARYSLKLEPAR